MTYKGEKVLHTRTKARSSENVRASEKEEERSSEKERL